MTKLLLLDDTRLLLVKAIADEYSRKILLSITTKPSSIEEICNEQHIPVSTCYKRIRALEIDGIVKKHATIVSDEGKKFIQYASTFKNVAINFDSEVFTVKVQLNGNSQEIESTEKISITVPQI